MWTEVRWGGKIKEDDSINSFAVSSISIADGSGVADKSEDLPGQLIYPGAKLKIVDQD